MYPLISIKHKQKDLFAILFIDFQQCWCNWRDELDRLAARAAAAAGGSWRVSLLPGGDERHRHHRAQRVVQRRHFV